MSRSESVVPPQRAGRPENAADPQRAGRPGRPNRGEAVRHALPPARVRDAQPLLSASSPSRTVVLLDGSRIAVAEEASVDQRIATIAGRQRARVARRQLAAAAVRDEAIARRSASGRLVRVHLGVYGLPHTEELPLAAETAALLACGEGAVLSHHSAATIYGLRAGAARPVHVTIPSSRGGPAPEGVVVHRSKILTAADVRLREGLPITSPARTAIDVAATMPDRDVELLLDEALFVRRIVTRNQLWDIIARAGGHPGRARLARLVRGRVRSTKTDSRPEERLLTLIRAAGLPEPRLQPYVLGYRLDFLWPELGLAVEVDAYGTHGSPARFESDRRRDARLLAEKRIVVLRLTRVAIERRPFEAIALLARAIAQRQTLVL